MRIFEFYKMFFTIKLPILVNKLITKDKPIRSYILAPFHVIFRTLPDARP